ncbi:MAG: helix-turn-helix domain-containing protein [Candidatus Hodarchaeaceae archaeon]|nr:helix-turn-helix domain-containing protein [Candidatus Hodarchaeaceae archaeon]
MFPDPIKDRVARWIAGDIALSEDPGSALKRWREIFGMSQTTLAEALHISSSVISDYEAGRRKSPGVATVRRIVEMFIKVDEKQGGQVARAFMHMFGTQLPPDIVLDIREFREPIDGKTLCKAVEGEVIINKELLDQKLFGYTIVDSYKAVIGLSADDFTRLYGLTTERALVFTGVTTGRSPMVAVKVMGITPGMVIFHGELKQVDPLGIKIAEILRVPLVISRLPSVSDLLESLRKCAA